MKCTCLGIQSLSIHDLHGEVDGNIICIEKPRIPFNSRPPWGGRLEGPLEDAFMSYLSIHDLHGEVDVDGSSVDMYKVLSIHDLHGEVDEQ